MDLLPSNGPLPATLAGSERANVNSTLNFWVPGDLLDEGTLRLEVEINHDRAVRESNYGNNEALHTRTLTERFKVNVVLAKVRYHIKQPGPWPSGTPTLRRGRPEVVSHSTSIVP